MRIKIKEKISIHLPSCKCNISGGYTKLLSAKGCTRMI